MSIPVDEMPAYSAGCTMRSVMGILVGQAGADDIRRVGWRLAIDANERRRWYGHELRGFQQRMN